MNSSDNKQLNMRIAAKLEGSLRDYGSKLLVDTMKAPIARREMIYKLEAKS